MTLQLGRHSYAGDHAIRAFLRTDAVVRVGNFCSIANGLLIIIDGNHFMEWGSTFPFSVRCGWGTAETCWGKETPTIGSDVWIGQNVTIYSGVHVGHGAVLAGNAVVTKSVPPYAVVAGNPAKIVKYRFSEPLIEKFLKSEWWDLPDEVIAHKLVLPCLKHPELFVKAALNLKLKEEEKTPKVAAPVPAIL